MRPAASGGWNKSLWALSGRLRGCCDLHATGSGLYWKGNRMLRGSGGWNRSLWAPSGGSAVQGPRSFDREWVALVVLERQQNAAGCGHGAAVASPFGGCGRVLVVCAYLLP